MMFTMDTFFCITINVRTTRTCLDTILDVTQCVLYSAPRIPNLGSPETLNYKDFRLESQGRIWPFTKQPSLPSSEI